MFSFSAKQNLVIIFTLVALPLVVVIGVFKFYFKPITKTTIVPTEEKRSIRPTFEVIGKSVEGRDIQAYTYGNGTTHLVFVGGIHGGYEWNSVALATTFMDYLDKYPEVIPKNLTIKIIPSVNPDGVYKVTGKEGRFNIMDVSTDKKVLASARFNKNEVDLNRNFDCKWKSKSMWQSKIVSAGTTSFSEPETKAIRNFMLKHAPIAVVFWHSQANGVYASQCNQGILPETLNMMNIYSRASGYPAIKTFDAYEITGAAEDWLASVGIPAITVELKTHETLQWGENLAGIKALIEHYRK